VSPVFKCFSAAGLVVAGFFSASLFGPPSALVPPTDDAAARVPQLLPLEAGGMAPTSQQRLADSGVTPATFTNPSAEPGGSVHAANYPAAPAAPSPWSSPLAEHESHPFAVPSIQRDTPSVSSPAAPSVREEGFANLTPPPRLGDFQGVAQQPPAASSPTEPPATFATQPASPDSPWWNRGEGAASPGPQPWSTHSPAAEMASAAGTQRAAESAPSWHTTSATNSRRWHIVSDGDSLPRLAERYLHDAARAQDIFEENRNVLDNPEVLPIGVELRIPEAGPRPTTVQVYDAAGAPHGDIQTRRQMVKLPEVSPTIANAPVARLRAPQSAGPGN
jgi:phage tail protein X